MKKEEKYSVGRPKLADTKLKKKSVIISCICLVAALALLITGAFELNILKFNSKKLKASANTNLCGNDINIIPEELRYSEDNPDGFKDIKFYSAVLSAGKPSTYSSVLYNSPEYCSTMTKEQLNQIGYLDASSVGLTDVSGIGYLTNLRYLYMSDNSIENINLTKNTLIEELNLSSNSISNINLESNINLIELNMYSNKLTNIEGIASLPKLVTVNLYNNKLQALSFFTNFKLAVLNISNNEIESLDLSNNNQISSLKINNNPLKKVILDNIKNYSYSSLSLDGCSNIENLSLKNTGIINLSITGVAKINNLDISNNGVNSFNIGNGVQIDNFVAENMPNLSGITLNNSAISSVKLNNLPKFYSLNLENNELSNIDLSNLTNITRLNLNKNNLTNIDLSNLTKLSELELANNNLNEIKGLSKLTNLSYVDLRKNNLSNIDVKSLINLRNLDLSNNNLSSFEFTEPTSVSNLILHNNQLTSVDLSNVNNLQYLDLSNNKLTSVDVSNITSLETLLLNNNNLKKIDGLSTLNNLEILVLHNNNLESIDLSGNTSLKGITLQNNPFGNTKYLLKGKTIDYKEIVNASDITFSLDNENIGSFDVSVLKTKEVGTLNVTASAKSLNEWAIDGRIMSIKIDYLDKCMNDENYDKNYEYCNNVSEEDFILPNFYENKVIVYDVLSNNYKVDSNNKTIDVSGLVPDTKYITLTEGLTGEIKNNKYLVKNSNNEVIEEFTILNPGKKEEEVKEVKTTTKSSSKRVIKPNKKVTTKKLEDINLTGSFVSSLMLNQVRGQDRKLTVINEDVTLTMLGKDIKRTDLNIDISYRITDVKETEVKDKVESGVVLDFVNKTTLPCTSQVEVNVKDKITGTVDIYRYENGTLVLIAENVRITDNKLTFNTDKLDTYVITNKLKKDVEVKEDKALVESNKKFNNKCLIIIPIIAIILLIGIGTYIYKKKMAK